MKKNILPVFALVSLLCTGCAKNETKSESAVTLTEYEKVTYETVEAVREDVVPEFTIDLIASDYVRRNYAPMYDNMEIDTVYVAVGDHVNAGDVMISFKSGKLGEQIEDYQAQIAEQNLLIEHYSKLMEIDSSLDYTDDIEQIKESIRINNLYISELNARLDAYNIKAEGSGTVCSISDMVQYGFVDTTCKSLVVVSYGNDNFHAQTSADYDFQIGERFTAVSGSAPYDIVLSGMEETGTDSDGNTIRSLTFVAADGTDFGSKDRLTLTIQKPVLKDVVYIPRTCIYELNGKTYVYMLDENGFRDIVEITCGDVVGDNQIILSGVSEGDWVVVQ